MYRASNNDVGLCEFSDWVWVWWCRGVCIRIHVTVEPLLGLLAMGVGMVICQLYAWQIPRLQCLLPLSCHILFFDLKLEQIVTEYNPV